MAIFKIKIKGVDTAIPLEKPNGELKSSYRMTTRYFLGIPLFSRETDLEISYDKQENSNLGFKH